VEKSSVGSIGNTTPDDVSDDNDNDGLDEEKVPISIISTTKSSGTRKRKGTTSGKGTSKHHQTN